MGHFNAACNVSRMQIRHGDQVRLIPLVLRDLKGILPVTSMAYSGEIATPSALPISGKYDDYGGIRNDGDYIVDTAAKIFDARLGEYHTRGVFQALTNDEDHPGHKFEDPAREEEHNKAGALYGNRHRYDGTRSYLDNFLEAAPQGEFETKEYSKLVRWTYTLVHEKMYTGLADVCFGKKEAGEMRESGKATLDAYLNTLIKYWKQVTTNFRNAAGQTDEDRTKWGSLFMAMFNSPMSLVNGVCPYSDIKFPEDSQVLYLFSSYERNVNPHSFDTYLNWMRDEVDGGKLTSVDDPRYQELRDAIVEFYLFSQAFNYMGMTHVPLRTTGQEPMDLKAMGAWMRLQNAQISMERERRRDEGW